MRERVPGVVLRTTMIVGHPGEGTREFNQLLSFVKEARFQRLGAFTYSEEEGTFGADNLKDSVRPSTKKKRLDILMEAQRGISLAYNQSRIGTEEKVLVDGFQDGVLVCRSEFESPEVDGEILVKVPSGVAPASLVGTFLKVRITGADEYDLIAEVI
jgi:ribosomal protein S12 methylthiotransferase